MILAVDPGLATCGWAIVRPRTARVITLGVWTSSPTEDVDEWTDRVRRIAAQAAFLTQLAKTHGVTRIAAEAVSCGGPPSARFSMGTSLCLSWGALAGIASTLDIELEEVPPKMWQHAICPGVLTIDYDEVFRRLRMFVEAQADYALYCVKPKDRNHALDAIGVGLYAALETPTKVTADVCAIVEETRGP